MQNASPLQPTPFSDALSILRRDGVVRIDGRSIDPTLCAKLRLRILEELEFGNSKWESSNSGSSATSSSEQDTNYVPGTRIRFKEPIDLSFGGDVRHDLLLPLTNSNWPELQPVLHSAITQLEPFLVDAVDQLLPCLHESTTTNTVIDPGPIELVELGSLIVRPGSNHQKFHGDYRRFAPLPGDGDKENTSTNPHMMQQEPLEHTKARTGKLPPRLVTFVALQDIPSKAHGSTGFVSGTNNGEAHGWVYDGQGIDVSDVSDGEAVAAATLARQSILDISATTARGVVTASGLGCGDVLVYDASVLHWGGPNTVPNNDRALLYFGVARSCAAAILSSQEENEQMVNSGFKIAPPVLMQDVASA